MGRIVDDIRHYFSQRGIDIVNAGDVRPLVADHLADLLNALSVRENYLCDLVTELVWAESNMDHNAAQMRSLLTLKRRVVESGIVEWVQNKSRGELYEEDE